MDKKLNLGLKGEVGDDEKKAAVNAALEDIFLSDIADAWETAFIVSETYAEPLELCGEPFILDGRQLNGLPIGQAVFYGAAMYALGKKAAKA